jgi:hypothetical protein
MWLAHEENDKTLLYPAMILFLGFSVTRTESALFIALFMVLAIAYDRFTPRVWWLVRLPYVAMSLIWQLWLLLSVRPDTDILTPERILLIIIVLTSTYLSPLVLLPPMRNILLNRLQNLMLAGMGLSLVGLLIIDQYHILLNIINSFSNLLLGGVYWWGGVWYFVILSIWLLRRSSKLDHARILSYGIIGFFLLTWLIGFARLPYRLGWGDSANRIFTHILPITLFYLALRLNAYLRTTKIQTDVVAQSES